MLLVVGALIMGLFLLLGTLFSAAIGLFLVILKGIGLVLGAFFKFAFGSIYSFALVTGLCYVAYRMYSYYKNSAVKKIEYSDSDFEPGNDEYYDWG